MDAKTIWLYIVVMAGVTYLIRMLPLALLRKKLRSRFIKSFLFYVPYAVLAVMTVPAIFESTGSVLFGQDIGVAAVFRRRGLRRGCASGLPRRGSAACGIGRLRRGILHGVDDAPVLAHKRGIRL